MIKSVGDKNSLLFKIACYLIALHKILVNVWEVIRTSNMDEVYSF